MVVRCKSGGPRSRLSASISTMKKKLLISNLIALFFVFLAIKPVLAYSDIGPTMTSYITPTPYVISDSSHYTNNPVYEGWGAFDKQTVQGGGNHEWISAANTIWWLQIDLGAGNEYALTAFRMQSRNYSGQVQFPKNYLFQGSNTTSTWTTLRDITSGEWPSSHAWTSWLTFTNTTGYRYYRLYITASQEGELVAMDEMELSGVPQEPPVFSCGAENCENCLNEAACFDACGIGHWYAPDLELPEACYQSSIQNIVKWVTGGVWNTTSTATYELCRDHCGAWHTNEQQCYHTLDYMTLESLDCNMPFESDEIDPVVVKAQMYVDMWQVKFPWNVVKGYVAFFYHLYVFTDIPETTSTPSLVINASLIPGRPPVSLKLIDFSQVAVIPIFILGQETNLGHVCYRFLYFTGSLAWLGYFSRRAWGVFKK